MNVVIVPGLETLAIECRPATIILTWDASAIPATYGLTVDGFEVYRSTVSSGPYTLLTPVPLPGTETTFLDATAAPNTTYYYVVKFLHDEPDCRSPGQFISYPSPFSNEVTASTCCPDPEGEFWTDDTPSAQQLAEWIVGPGFTVQNASYTGAAVAKGIFGNGFNADLPLDKGVILSSGDIALAEGENDKSDAAKFNDGSDDIDLNNLVPGLTTRDAAVLEFDVISAVTTNLVFEYVFASEEYPEWISQYNDIMAIFVDGVNIAVVPGTSLPVAVNNINGGCVSDFYQNPQPATHPNYYVDNHDPNYSALPAYAANTPVYDLQYDGTTVVLTAQTNISANVTYHLKIAIADATDWIYDSAVFIKANVPCP